MKKILILAFTMISMIITNNLYAQEYSPEEDSNLNTQNQYNQNNYNTNTNQYQQEYNNQQNNNVYSQPMPQNNTGYNQQPNNQNLYGNAQTNTMTQPGNDTKRLQLMFINCRDAKGKVIGENIKIETIIDGYELNMPINKKLKTGNTWGINQIYDFLDFIIVRFWDINVFKNNLVGEIKFDRNNIGDYKTITINSKDIIFDITYQVTPGPGYRNMILGLRQNVSEANSELIQLRKSNKDLSSQVNVLQNDNEMLRNKLYNEKKK